MQDLMSQIRGLSSGTIASCLSQAGYDCGYYDLIDLVAHLFIKFAETRKRTERWQDVWEEYIPQLPIALGCIAISTKVRVQGRYYGRVNKCFRSGDCWNYGITWTTCIGKRRFGNEYQRASDVEIAEKPTPVTAPAPYTHLPVFPMLLSKEKIQEVAQGEDLADLIKVAGWVTDREANIRPDFHPVAVVSQTAYNTAYLWQHNGTYWYSKFQPESVK